MGYVDLESRIGEVVRLLKGTLSDPAASVVLDYSERHGEYGLALEELLGAIDDEHVVVPSTGIAILRELERAMGPIDPEAAEVLERLEQGENVRR